MIIHFIKPDDAGPTGTSLATTLRSRWPLANVIELTAGGMCLPDTRFPPDLTIILDFHSPADTGADIVAVRSVSDCPIVIVALDSLRDTEAGWLRLGADAVVTAHSMFRLLALLDAPGLGAGGDDPPHVEERTIGDLRLDTSQQVLSVAHRRVAVTTTEFRLIEAFAAQFGRFVPSSDLMRTLWGLENDAVRKSLKVHICRLRHKLSEAGSTCTVNAIRGFGYALALRDDVAPAENTPSVERVQSTEYQ